MKPEEYRQRQGYPLYQDPRHEPIKIFFHLRGSNFLNFKSENDPLGQVEQKEENRDLAAGHNVFLIAKVFLKRTKHILFFESKQTADFVFLPFVLDFE